MSSIFSIYIPRMQNTVTDEYINYVFCQERIGSVVRVDFTSVGQKPGFVEKTDDVVKCAFVYLFLYNTPESVSFKNKVLEGNGHRVYLNGLEKTYWIVLPNKNPVQFTMMNNSQIVDNCRYLEKKIETQSKKIEEQAETIKMLEEKLDGVQQSVYQLIGGLFNHGNQRNILEEHINCLFPGTTHEYTGDALSEKNKWTVYPTTRQGDECESRIEALEKQLQDMLKYDCNEKSQHYEEENYEDYYEDHYDESELSHRCNINYIYKTIPSFRRHCNMPNAIDDVSSTHSSIPDLFDVTSDDSGERIRNSCELCGNE